MIMLISSDVKTIIMQNSLNCCEEEKTFCPVSFLLCLSDATLLYFEFRTH